MEKSKIILSSDCLPYYLCQIEKNRYSLHRKKQKFLNVMMNAGKETCAFIFNKHFWIAKKCSPYLSIPNFRYCRSKASTATKPNTIFAAISKKPELLPTKTAKFRVPETNYSWSRWTRHICWKFIWRYQWKWLIWTTRNKLSPWQLWCPSTTFWKYWGKGVFAYVKVPRHVNDELLKLHGIGFKGKMLVIEKVKTPPKAKNINGMNQNICPQTQPSQLDSDPENYVASRPFQRIKNLSKCCHP